MAISFRASAKASAGTGKKPSAKPSTRGKRKGRFKKRLKARPATKAAPSLKVSARGAGAKLRSIFTRTKPVAVAKKTIPKMKAAVPKRRSLGLKDPVRMRAAKASRSLGLKDPVRMKTAIPEEDIVAPAKMTWWGKIPLLTKIAAVAASGTSLYFKTPAVVIPSALGFAGIAGWQHYKQKQCLTPERKKIYEEALTNLKDPAKLRVLADEFEKGGCPDQAEHLRKRATLRERTPEETQEDRSMYREALRSRNPNLIKEAISYFKQIGADGTVANLQKRLEALKAIA